MDTVYNNNPISVAYSYAPAEVSIMLDDHAFPPVREHELDAGLDLRSPSSVKVPAHGSAVIDTGVHILIPRGYAGFLKSKSGLNVKHNITSDGTIDAGYTGSITVKLYNHGEEDYYVKGGDKVSQLVIQQVCCPRLNLVNKMPETERGDNGFGSTGK